MFGELGEETVRLEEKKKKTQDIRINHNLIVKASMWLEELRKHEPI